MNFLSDLIPAKWRKVVYGTVGLLSLLAAIPGLLPEAWQAQAVAVLAVLSSALAVGNVAPKDQPGGDPPKDAGQSTIITVVCVLAIIALCMYIFGRR
jgi:hypothetical protein